VPVFLNHHSAADFVAMIKAQFDVLHREGAESGRVMCLAIHPYLMGTPQRARYLEEVLDYINGHDGVWHTTAGEIADHFLANNYDGFVAHAAALLDEFPPGGQASGAGSRRGEAG
jgi:allantoinase